MHCHVCQVAVDEGQQFCRACGSSLRGVTDPTQPISSIDSSGDDDVTVLREQALRSETASPPRTSEPTPASHRGELPDLANQVVGDGVGPRSEPRADDAWWDGAGSVGPMPQPPTQPIEAMSPPLPATAAIESLAHPLDATRPMDTAPAFEPTIQMSTADSAARNVGVITDQLPSVDGQGALFDGAADVTTYELDEPQGFRLRASFVFAVLGLLATLMASVADIVDVRTSRPVDGIAVGLRTMEEFGTNLSVAGIIGAGLMLLGSLLSCFGLRWGAGLAGGSGLAMVGWAATTLGLVEVPIKKAEAVTSTAGADVNGFTLFITRDLGWFLIIAVAALGLIVFLASLRMARSGGRAGLNPWVAAVGALAMVIVAAGPLIPLGGAALDVNLGIDELPREFFASRLIHVGLIALTGVLGFLSVRTYGLGFAAGGLGVSVWLWITTLVELGDPPIVGIAVGNIGTSSTTPHAVTTVAMTASIVMIAVAATLAIVSRPRRR
jgi:hypothetical protein